MVTWLAASKVDDLLRSDVCSLGDGAPVLEFAPDAACEFRGTAAGSFGCERTQALTHDAVGHGFFGLCGDAFYDLLWGALRCEKATPEFRLCSLDSSLGHRRDVRQLSQTLGRC